MYAAAERAFEAALERHRMACPEGDESECSRCRGQGYEGVASDPDWCRDCDGTGAAYAACDLCGERGPVEDGMSSRLVSAEDFRTECRPCRRLIDERSLVGQALELGLVEMAGEIARRVA